MKACERVREYTRFTDAGMHREGYGHDSNNCCVRAIAVAFRLSYKEAYGICAAAGRKHGEGAYMHDIIDYMKCIGYTANQLLDTQWITVNQFVKSYSHGRFIAVIHEHTFPIINGYIWDASYPNPRSRIYRLWEVEPVKRQKYMDQFIKLHTDGYHYDLPDYGANVNIEIERHKDFDL